MLRIHPYVHLHGKSILKVYLIIKESSSHKNIKNHVLKVIFP